MLLASAIFMARWRVSPRFPTPFSQPLTAVCLFVLLVLVVYGRQLAFLAII